MSNSLFFYYIIYYLKYNKFLALIHKICMCVSTTMLFIDGQYGITLLHHCPAELLVFIFHHLKLELLTQFPASNDEKYLYIMKNRHVQY